MAFLGFGKKNETKKPLTEPLGSNKVADLPPQDNFLKDPGLPKTPSIEPSEEAPGLGTQRKTEEFYSEKNEPVQKYPGQDQSSSGLPNKDLELISSKLDYLRAAIENLSHRLESLENLAKQEQEQKYRW